MRPQSMRRLAEGSSSQPARRAAPWPGRRKLRRARTRAPAAASELGRARALRRSPAAANELSPRARAPPARAAPSAPPRSAGASLTTSRPARARLVVDRLAPIAPRLSVTSPRARPPRLPARAPASRARPCRAAAAPALPRFAEEPLLL
nr:60S ribosomal protein L22-like [Aegilops tauschii subsp. strangulata]